MALISRLYIEEHATQFKEYWPKIYAITQTGTMFSWFSILSACMAQTISKNKHTSPFMHPTFHILLCTRLYLHGEWFSKDGMAVEAKWGTHTCMLSYSMGTSLQSTLNKYLWEVHSSYVYNSLLWTYKMHQRNWWLVCHKQGNLYHKFWSHQSSPFISQIHSRKVDHIGSVMSKFSIWSWGITFPWQEIFVASIALAHRGLWNQGCQGINCRG